MPKKLSQKTNTSSTQVLKTLRVLMQGDYSMNDLVDILNKNEADAIFNNSVISKYINTCRFCDFEIPKIHNKYYVAKIPFGLDLSNIDVDIIKSLQAFVQDEMASKYTNIINSFVSKICRFSNKEIKKVEKDEFLILLELFERAIAKKRKVKLLFKNRDTLECIPLYATKNKDKMLFYIFNKKPRCIDSTRLAGIQLSGQRYIEPFGGDQIVVFKLKGALAKRYEARPNETVEVNDDNTSTVSNKNENKEILFSRLLRYDDKCEIIHPVGYREDMKELINNMLGNYGVD